MVTVVRPTDPQFVADYGQFLPLAETIGRSAVFARDRNSDRAQEAFCSWLDAWDLDTETPELDPMWNVTRYVRVTARSEVTIMLPRVSDSSAWDAWQRVRMMGGSYQTGTLVRGIIRDLRMEYARVSLDGSTSPDYSSAESIEDTQGQTIGYRYAVIDGWSSSGSCMVRAESSDAAIHSADWAEYSRMQDPTERARVFRPIAWSEALQRLLAFRAPEGMTVRVTVPEVSTSDESSAYEYTRSDYADIAADVAEVWEELGAAGIASKFGIRTDDAIPTDSWLTMVRETAMDYQWCDAHHALVTRVTHGTRSPFGIVTGGTYEGTINLTLRVSGGTDSKVITDFHGWADGDDDERPELDHYQLNRLIERAISNEYGVSVDSEVADEDWETSSSGEQEPYEPGAHRTVQWAALAERGQDISN